MDPPNDTETVIRNLQLQLAQMNDRLTALTTTPIAALPAPAPIVNLKPDRPPPFSGKKGESLEAWVFQMSQYCQLLPVPIDSRVQFAATFLREHAALWWRTYNAQFVWDGIHANPPVWREFLTALRLQFIPVNAVANAYDRLRRLSQRTSVNTYSHEFRALMLEIPDMDDTTRVHFYIQGLKDHVRPLVAMQQPENVAAAEAIAERVDAVTF
jgi:hypothetical protein